MNNICLILIVALLVVWLIYRSRNNFKSEDQIDVFLADIPNSYWEEDFIKNDLLGDISTNYIKVPKISDLHTYKKSDIGKNILVYSTLSPDSSYQNILKAVKELNSSIIIHISDEWGQRPEHNELAKYTNLVLRQYNHPGYPHYDNIIHITCAYMTRMFEPNYLQIPLKDPLERKYIWSFVGAIKKDRQKMIDTLSDIQPNYVTNGIKPSEMRETHRESIFSPNGRGNATLDCSRIYQATICGSIPVVVGTDKELRNTFFIYDEDPPWIFAENWNEAKKKMLYLLQNKELLLQQYNKLKPWWANLLRNTKKHISNALYNE